MAEAAVQAINNENAEENSSVDATVIDKDTAQERLDYLYALLVNIPEPLPLKLILKG